MSMVEAMFHELGFSKFAQIIDGSVTHGTRAKISSLNNGCENIIDLSIGSIDLDTSIKIDEGLCSFIKNEPHTIHDFAPVKGFAFLRERISARVSRLRGVDYDKDTEVLVSPGGIKGAITVALKALLDVGDEVIVPLPNWPHYTDMVHLHGGITKYIYPDYDSENDLSAKIEGAISDSTKLIVLGDCINPIGKIYSSEELIAVAKVIAQHNQRRKENNKYPIYILFDCPYESHILGERPVSIQAIKVGERETENMKNYTVYVTGPGKTYGMHGDRVGYMCASPEMIQISEKVQVNMNSFASNYGQVATYIALQEDMDEVARARAEIARENLLSFHKKLTSLKNVHANIPDGGYFLFVDFSFYRKHYNQLGYDGAQPYLLNEAGVASISGSHFYGEDFDYNHFVRLNCGRNMDKLEKAFKKLKRLF